MLHVTWTPAANREVRPIYVQIIFFFLNVMGATYIQVRSIVRKLKKKKILSSSGGRKLLRTTVIRKHKLLTTKKKKNNIKVQGYKRDLYILLKLSLGTGVPTVPTAPCVSA